MKSTGRPTDLATRSPRKTLADALEKNKARLAEAAAGFVKPEDLIRLALIATSRNQDLLKCSTESIIRSLMDASQLRIQPGGLMGRGYLVPRKNSKTGALECCFDPGYRGMIDVALRSDDVQSISAHVVYANEKFKFVAGTEDRIEHEVMLVGDRGAIIAAYAVARYKSGGKQVELVPKEDLDKIRKASPSKTGPWATWPEEMSRKTAVRRLFKYLPYSDERQRVMELSDKADGIDFEAITQADAAEATEAEEPEVEVSSDTEAYGSSETADPSKTGGADL